MRGGLPPASESMGRSGPGVRIENVVPALSGLVGLKFRGEGAAKLRWDKASRLDLAKPSFERSWDAPGGPGFFSPVTRDLPGAHRLSGTTHG